MDEHDPPTAEEQPEEPHEERARQEVTVPALLELLSEGELELMGLMPWSSNYTFLCTVRHGELATYAVYKPREGERPLWDFPSGTLCKREVAAFLVSDALGWLLVPPTVLRDGPHGEGSVQFFIDADQEEHFFSLRDEHGEQFQRMAVFDALINNADRKGGHCLIDDDGHIWAIDHGIAFHDEDKLRTVIWDWAGQPIPADLLEDVRRVSGELAPSQPLAEALSGLLLPRELTALRRRADLLVERGCFPRPTGGRSVPWPAI